MAEDDPTSGYFGMGSNKGSGQLIWGEVIIDRSLERIADALEKIAAQMEREQDNHRKGDSNGQG